MLLRVIRSSGLLAILVFAFLLAAPLPSQAKPPRGGGDDKGDEGEGGDDNSQEEKRKQEGGDADDPNIRIVATPLDHLETPCVEDKRADLCLQAGLKWRAGVTGYKGGKPDFVRAENFLRAGCYFGSAVACVHAGNMFLNVEAGIRFEGDGTVSLDFGTAANLFDLACRGDIPSACGVSGDLYFQPAKLLPNSETSFRDFEPDQIAARQFFEMGCPATWLPGGADRKTLEDGEQPPVDARSCSRMGEFFARGITMRPIVSKGAEYMELACLIDDSDAICDRAEALRESAQEEEARKRDRKGTSFDDDFVRTTTGRGTGAQAATKPPVRRFDDDSVGLQEKESIVRFEFELPIGVRWVYGPTTEPLFTVGFALDWWFALVGIAVDFTYSTDDLLRPAVRDYGRIQLAILGKVAIPLPLRLTIPARLILVPGVGGQFGNRTLAGSETPALQGGLVERIELRLSSPQRQGPRQWGGIRFEQQQSWIQYTHGGVEHASQFMAVFGFTFGGVGPEKPKKKERLEDE
jgi:hypothetical protein